MANASTVARCRAAATLMRRPLSHIRFQHALASSMTPTFVDVCYHHHQRRFRSSIVPKDEAEAAKLRLNTLLKRLHRIDTAALCDADKGMLARRQNGADDSQSDHPYVGLSLMDSRIKPRNYFPGPRSERGLPTGVYNASSGRYESSIGWGDKNRHIGTFDTPEQASAAYISVKKDLVNADFSACEADEVDAAFGAAKKKAADEAVGSGFFLQEQQDLPQGVEEDYGDYDDVPHGYI